MEANKPVFPPSQGISLTDAVARLCEQAGVDPNTVSDIFVNHPEAPTKIIVIFNNDNDLSKAMLVEMKYPQQG